jgi:hypothetical protein
MSLECSEIVFNEDETTGNDSCKTHEPSFPQNGTSWLEGKFLKLKWSGGYPASQPASAYHGRDTQSGKSISHQGANYGLPCGRASGRADGRWRVEWPGKIYQNVTNVVLAELLLLLRAGGYGWRNPTSELRCVAAKDIWSSLRRQRRTLGVYMLFLSLRALFVPPGSCLERFVPPAPDNNGCCAAAVAVSSIVCEREHHRQHLVISRGRCGSR